MTTPPPSRSELSACDAPSTAAPSWLAEHVPHPGPFACEVTVHRGQLSRGVDHVSNVEYVAWLDRAAELHCDAWGFTRQRMLADGVMWFVARHEIDYRAEAHPGDRLLLLTWVRDVRRVKSWRDSVIVRPDDRTLVCRASTLWVFVDLATRRPRRVPQRMLDRIFDQDERRAPAQAVK